MTIESRLAIGFLIVALLFEASLCYAQSGKAELFGLILDASGLPVPQVTVELEDQATLVKQSSTTSERGEYHFFGLGLFDHVMHLFVATNNAESRSKSPHKFRKRFVIPVLAAQSQRSVDNSACSQARA